MNSLQKRKIWNLSHLLLLLGLTVLCYWPLAFGMFSAKNDNITAFLPVRFQVSEALRSGHLPLWSPYLYLGFPVHGDMQGGAWNPVVWFLSLFGRYHLTSLHAEILLYIFLAGAGFYRFLRSVELTPVLALTGAAAYLMCGFITDTGGSNLPFLAAAAWLPFVFAYFIELLHRPGRNPALKLSVSSWLLLTSAYPSFTICAFYILTAALLIIVFKRGKNRTYLKTLFSSIGISAFVFFLLSAPALLSYLQILPFYHRSDGLSLQQTFYNSFSPFCTWSYILPAAPAKDLAAATTDPISRNGYFNIFFLLLLFCFPWAQKKTARYFLLGGLAYFFLFSLGGYTPVREWSFRVLPFMDTFRHPANARLFVIMAGILLGAMILQDFLEGRLQQKYPMVTTAITLGILLLLLFVYRPGEYSFTKFSFRHNGSLKSFLNALGWRELFITNVVFQAGFLLAAIAGLRKHRTEKWWCVLIVLNSFLLAQTVLPFTLVSQRPPSVINSLLRSFPKGYPAPDPQQSIGALSTDALDHLNIIGIESFYNKKPALPDVQFTPSFLVPVEKLVKDTAQLSRVLSHPYAYLQPEGRGGNFILTRFWNNGFQFRVTQPADGFFCLQQVRLPGWKCSVDGKQVPIEELNSAFMKVALPAGNHEVRFTYQPRGILLCFLLSVSTLIIALIFLYLKPLRDQ